MPCPDGAKAEITTTQPLPTPCKHTSSIQLTTHFDYHWLKDQSRIFKTIFVIIHITSYHIRMLRGSIQGTRRRFRRMSGSQRGVVASVTMPLQYHALDDSVNCQLGVLGNRKFGAEFLPRCVRACYQKAQAKMQFLICACVWGSRPIKMDKWVAGIKAVGRYWFRKEKNVKSPISPRHSQQGLISNCIQIGMDWTWESKSLRLWISGRNRGKSAGKAQTNGLEMEGDMIDHKIEEPSKGIFILWRRFAQWACTCPQCFLHAKVAYKCRVARRTSALIVQEVPNHSLASICSERGLFIPKNHHGTIGCVRCKNWKDICALRKMKMANEHYFLPCVMDTSQRYMRCKRPKK